MKTEFSDAAHSTRAAPTIAVLLTLVLFFPTVAEAQQSQELLYTSVGANALSSQEEFCLGDCNGDGAVTIDEILTCIGLNLGVPNARPCSACEVNPDAEVTVPNIIGAVNNALLGCPAPTTPTPTPTSSAPIHSRAWRKRFATDPVLFDPTTVGLERTELVADLPGGAARLIQRALGVEYVLVNGEPLADKGKQTSACSGAVLR